MEKRDKAVLLKQLARELGMTVSETNDYEEDSDDTEKATFTPKDWKSKDFPDKSVKNMDSLMEHVRQEFFCADPVKYEQVWRQIRISKSRTVRAYAMGMYTNTENIMICQMCKEQAEVTEIANYKIEMNQLNLCLCRNCAGKYRMLRDNNKQEFKNKIKGAISYLNIGDNDGEYKLELNLETSVYFTQTHVAEIQAIFRLLDEYGLPDQTQEFDKNILGPLIHPDYVVSESMDVVEEIAATEEDNGKVKNGSFVEYKAFGTGEIKKITISQDTYSIHKAFIGKQEGDKVYLSGKQYEIISIL